LSKSQSFKGWKMNITKLGLSHSWHTSISQNECPDITLKPTTLSQLKAGCSWHQA